MQWVNLSGTDSTCLSVLNPTGPTSTPVTLTNCTFDGTTLVSGKNAIQIIGSPTKTISIQNCIIQNAAGGTWGLWLESCNVMANNLTVTGCVTNNSQIKKVTGTFNACNF